MKALISNPPFNLKWESPPFAQIQPRFADFSVPPESNANFAFILSGLQKAERCVFILPQSILQSKDKKEKEIRKQLICKNYVEAVISCPDNMFEVTGVGTCILVLNKQKTTATVEFIDLREKYEIEEREQRGQYGSKAHTNRVYTKQYKVFSEDTIIEALQCISEGKSIPSYCKNVSIQEAEENEYTLSPGHYIEIVYEESIHRSYKEITEDINRIIREKNACKLTINETLAKSMGFDIALYKKDAEDNKDFNEMLKKLGAEPLIQHNYFVTSKNKNEIKFENASKEILSSVLVMILNGWKQHIYYLNQEENRYLAELMDALLPDLMSGKIEP